ncbi:glycosyltransferase family 4 protein [Sphingosinicella microcystinivorans]|uniref:glycosyltransferase family 4 protein n=1 Tax=Sphingosinicella microcystinivorans TaxID=335406 RepID=UPI0022F38C08|nr:glycosyltransferase [Sphingosinicella microcystinivorans]WBX84777.1 glycosyltransferase [Sphingosinicella microcystinivorans]
MIVLHLITDLDDGGAEAVLYRLCRHDPIDRHHVVSLMDAGKYGPLLEAHGVAVTCLDMPRGRIKLSSLWRLWRLLRQVRPDVVQTWMYHADLLGGVGARLAGIRNVNWSIHHTTLVPNESRRSTILVAKLCALLSRFIPRVIVCCARKSREVHSRLGYDEGRMHVIPNGYDLNVFQPDPDAGAALRADLGLGIDASVIGFVARHDPLKDHRNLLQALNVLKTHGEAPVCLLIGSGMDADNEVLAGLISDMGLGEHVRLLGRRSDVPIVMNALDLHVMSSRSEAFPNVLAEAMACGTPCVSTDVGDAAEIIGDTGWIVPPRDPEALADAIAKGLREQTGPARPTRREAARRRVAERFSIERMVDSYRTVWFGTSHETSKRENVV